MHVYCTLWNIVILCKLILSLDYFLGKWELGSSSPAPYIDVSLFLRIIVCRFVMGLPTKPPCFSRFVATVGLAASKSSSSLVKYWRTSFFCLLMKISAPAVNLFFPSPRFFLKTGSGMLLPNWQKSSLLYGERWKHSSSASFGDLNRNLYNHYRMGNSEKSLRAAESFMISRSIIVYNVGGWLFFIRWYLGQSGSVIRNFQASDNTGKQKLSGGVP